MSTSWFSVDPDGQVAFIDYDRNGPVPLGTPPDSSLVDILLVAMEERSDDGTVKSLNYTKEQVREMLTGARPAQLDDMFIHDILFQIDIEKEDIFLDSVINKRLADATEKCYCLSREFGVYSLDEYDYPEALFRQMVEERIIVKTLSMFGSTNCISRGDHIEYENELSNFPYYVYNQPYWPEYPIRRLSVPRYPIKIGQFPVESQEAALRLPFLFKDTDSFFIQHYCQSKFQDGTIEGPADCD